MAHTIHLPFLLRRISYRKHQIIRPARLPILSNPFATKPLSSLSSSLETNAATNSDPKPTSLSARMSFVFDQIDTIEKERAQKDEALQRIRAWRESKRSKTSHEDDNKKLSFDGELNPSKSLSAGTGSSELKVEEEKKERVGLLDREVELVHPWPEWIELMERLVQQNYFDHRRKDEDKMMRDLGFQMSEVAEEVFDFTRDWRTVETACLNFGRDRFDILRSLSRQDISTLVGYGCPSADKKVVFSAKLLRKHAHLDEGDVCSSCNLRNSCEKAYLLTNKEDEARTIDVMRVLLIYGFDPVNGSVVNESLLKRKSVKAVIRKLLHEVVKLSAVPIDPNLPPPIIKKPPPKVKQPPPPPKKRVGRDDIEMKKGDWLCPKCDFMNFAKNTVCLQCDAKRPQRQLLPGEWECPQCKFLNYRRNMVCFHCEHKRPPDAYMENQLQDRNRGSKTRLENAPSRAEISNAWNFDFDDNESDGADVAAFEYADSRKMDEDFRLHMQAEGEHFKGSKDDSYMSNLMPRMHEREHNDRQFIKPGIGFDDFDDEEDDDIDSYELDKQNNNQAQKSSAIDFSDVEGLSESEDNEDFEEGRISHQTRSWSQNKASRTMRRKSTLSGSKVDELDFDTDDDLPVHPNWESSHVADSRQRNKGKGAISFGSDEDDGLSSDTEDIVNSNSGSRRNKGDKRISSSWDSRKRVIPVSNDETFSSLDTDDEDLPTLKQRSRGRTVGPNRRGYSKSNNDFNGSSQTSRVNARGFRRDGYGGHGKKNDRESGFRNFRGSNAEGFGNGLRGGFNDYNDRDYTDDRYTRQRINVR